MSETGTLAIILVCYFILVSIILGILGGAGILEETGITYEENPVVNSGTAVNESASTIIPASTSEWNLGDSLQTVIGFYTFDLVLGIGSYEWIIKLIFAWLPIIALSITIYCLLRGI